MTIHNLKIDVAPFNDLLSGAKTGEVRNDDRGFEIGDTVYLTCTDGRTSSRTISHIQRGYGLPDGLCVLSYTRATPSVDTHLCNTKDVENHAAQNLAHKPDTLAELKRFGLVLTLRGIPDVEEQFSGEYVLYSEAAAVVAQKDARIVDGEQERQGMAKDWFNFCELIGADIDSHEAVASYVRVIKERAEDAEAELAKIKDMLKDGNAVHISMLRGDIGIPTTEQINHIYASPVSVSLKAENERLREALTVASMSAGFQYMTFETRALIDAALKGDSNDKG